MYWKGLLEVGVPQNGGCGEDLLQDLEGFLHLLSPLDMIGFTVPDEIGKGGQRQRKKALTCVFEFRGGYARTALNCFWGGLQQPRPQ